MKQFWQCEYAAGLQTHGTLPATRGYSQVLLRVWKLPWGKRGDRKIHGAKKEKKGRREGEKKEERGKEPKEDMQGCLGCKNF